mmetsp:Transcript_20842/g.56927  ORF Transcript_20842/g.56927 Transcript_20842/m.56927 type:complete len:207 (+) Transcript_20842:602-1222(+)
MQTADVLEDVIRPSALAKIVGPCHDQSKFRQLLLAEDAAEALASPGGDVDDLAAIQVRHHLRRQVAAMAADQCLALRADACCQGLDQRLAVWLEHVPVGAEAGGQAVTVAEQPVQAGGASPARAQGYRHQLPLGQPLGRRRLCHGGLRCRRRGLQLGRSLRRGHDRMPPLQHRRGRRDRNLHRHLGAVCQGRCRRLPPLRIDRGRR